MARGVGQGWGHSPRTDVRTSCPICLHPTSHTHCTAVAGRVTNPDVLWVKAPYWLRDPPPLPAEGSRDGGGDYSRVLLPPGDTGTGDTPKGEGPSPAPKMGAGNGQMGPGEDHPDVALLTADRLRAPSTPLSPSCSHGQPWVQGRNQASFELLFPPFEMTSQPLL